MKKSTTGEFETAVFAARLRELIRDTKTTQKDLAKAIGAAKKHRIRVCTWFVQPHATYFGAYSQTL